MVKRTGWYTREDDRRFGSVTLGLVENVDHLFVSEKHLAGNERTRSQTVSERRTTGIMALTRVYKRAGRGEAPGGEGLPW